MALSIDEYRKMKSENKFFWDTDSLKQTQNDINDYLRGVGNQANGAEMWSDDEFNNQRSQISGLRGRLNALQAYANSVKDQDKSAYDGLMQAHSSLKNGLNEAEKWFNGNTDEVRKQQKLYKAVEAMQGFRSTAAEQAAKYGLDEKEIQDAYDKKWQYEQELNTYKAVEAMKKGSTTAAEQAAKYGLNIEKTQEAYDNNSKYLRAELQKDKYDSLSYDELYNLVTDPKSYAEKISGQVADFYLGEKEAYNEIAKWYNITPEQVREFYEGSKEAHTAAGYASAALSDEDRKYVIQRMLETGTAEQLEQLKNDNKVINKMFKVIPELNQAIEDKKEEEYYLSVLEKFPNAEKVINNHYGWESMNQKSPDSVTYREDMQPDISSNEEFEANKREYQKLVDAGVDTARFHKFEKRYKEHQEALKKNEEWAQLANEHPVGASLLSIPMNMIGSVGDVITYAEASRDDGYVNTAGTMNRQAQTIRDTVNKKINNPVGQFFYSTGMSVGDMALAAAVDRIMPGAMGAVMSGGMFFSSAGVNAANEVIDSGGNYDQAAWTLVAQGAAELVFEEISLDKIVKLKANRNIKGIKDVVINTLKQMGIESSEEVATSIANAITDGITNKDLSEFERNKRAYIDSGMSEEEANGAAVRDFFGGLLTDALGGAVSGGVMGGGASTYAAVRNNIAMNNVPVSLGGVELTAKQAKKLAPEYYHELAQELTQSKDFDVNTLIEQAKQGGEKSQKLAAAMEKTVAEKGKDAITSADVENVLISLYGDNIKARQTGENIESAAAIESIDKAANQSRAESFFEQNLSEYDETGAKKTEGGNTDVKTTRAFGASHPNGLYATENGKQIIITGIESVVKEYGGDGSTVTLKTDDGKKVNAAGVSFNDPDIQRLVNLAPNYDSLGARALLANYEEARNRGLSTDDYIVQSEALYKIGRSGVTFENAVKSPEFSGIIKSMGENAAKSFLNAGNNDTEAHVKFNDINLRRVRVPGAKTSARSRVWAESSVEINASPEFMSIMQAIAEVVSKDGKVGRDIVFTDRLSGEDAGVYSNGKIYISAESDEHVAITTALHEAVHKAKVYAPAEYRALEKFVMNYLVANGQDVKTLLDNIAAIWGQDAADIETQREELIAQTVAALASDENAFMKAVQIKENKSLLDKVREALKTIIEHVKKFFRDVDEQGRKYGHNIQAQPWLDDLKALEGLAEKFSYMMKAVRENEAAYGARESEVKHLIKYTEDNEPVVIVTDCSAKQFHA